METPNLEILRDISSNISKEYDLENRLNRYKNLSPELIKFASDLGLPAPEEAVRALFATDFIITASEVPMGSVDEERYSSVIKTFIQGKLRCDSSDSLLQIIYLAYKTATIIRRQDLFMAGRGIDRKVALIRIKDCYITPFLQITSEIMGLGLCGWELGILSAALTRNYPDVEINKYIMVPEHSNHEALTEPIWKLLENYAEIQKVETNTNIVIPNVNSSQSLLLFGNDDPPQISLWGIKPKNFSKLRTSIQSISQNFDRELSLQDKQFVFLRGTLLDSSKSLFILKNPYTKSKLMCLFVSSVDEINLTRMLTVLGLRGLEQDGWKALFSKPELVVEEKQIPSTLIEEIPMTIEKTSKESLPERTGFISNIFSKLFGKKERKVKTVPIPTEKKKVKKRKKKEDKKEKGQYSSIIQSEFLSQAITIDAVSDIDLYETFDTIREEPKGYSIIGIFETSFEGARTTIMSSAQTDISVYLTNFVEKFDTVIKSIDDIFEKKIPFLPKEVFFINKDNNQKLIISLNGDQDRVVGTIASSEFDKITDWQSRGEEKETLQRRSLHMRTSQFLSARRHTPFEDAIERIYIENFDVKNAKEDIIDKRIPFLEQLYRSN